MITHKESLYTNRRRSSPGQNEASHMVILIYISKIASWKAPNGGAISRNCCITHSRRGKPYYALRLHINQKCLLEGGRYVKKKPSRSPIGRLGVVTLFVSNIHLYAVCSIIWCTFTPLIQVSINYIDLFSYYYTKLLSTTKNSIKVYTL